MTAAMIPPLLPVVGEFRVSVDGGPQFSSSKLRWQEKFDFTIPDDGWDAPATFEAHGFAIGRQPFRIHVGGLLAIDSSVPVKRWWIGTLLGIVLGIALVIAVASLVAIATIIFYEYSY